MIRVLVLIAGVGLVLSVVCFSGAAALGGRDLVARGWRLPDDWRIRVDEDGAHIDDPDFIDGGGVPASREIAWTGGEDLTVDVPAEVRFTQAESAPGKLVVSGPKGSVDNLVLEDGRLRYADHLFNTGRLLIVMTAPKVTRFQVNGSDKLVIAAYRQDALHIELNGSGDVSAAGRAQSAEVDVAGSGEVDLGQLAAESERVGLSGSGRALIAPRSVADVDVSGSGDVTLLTRPASVHSQVSGSGRVIQTGTDAAPVTSQPG